MLFLIEYDRSSGKLESIRTYPVGARKAAEDARLNLELQLNAEGVDREVVLLEAESEEALRRTHRRYFEDYAKLVKPPPDAIRDHE